MTNVPPEQFLLTLVLSFHLKEFHDLLSVLFMVAEAGYLLCHLDFVEFSYLGNVVAAEVMELESAFGVEDVEVELFDS